MTSIDFGGAQIWPVLGPPLRKQRLRLGVLDRWRDDDVLALLPIGRGGDALGVAELERIDHAQDLVEIAPDAHRIGHRQRSEERRVGKECVSTCRSRWSPYR